MSQKVSLRYSLDTSAIMDGYIRYYPPDIFPKLWDENFESLINDGAIKSTILVRHELKKRDDDLFNWICDKDIFVEVDDGIQHEVTAIMRTYPKLVAEGGNRSTADPFVIAFAKQYNCVVVTGEKGGTEDKPKIPFVCGELGIECISFLELIRREGWKF